MSLIADLVYLLRGNEQRDRVVPPTGYTAWLTLFTSAAMAFLVVFSLALSFAADRLGDRWSIALSQAMTLRLSAPTDQLDRQTTRALEILNQTAGIKSARILSDKDHRALLSPWFGPDVPIENLPIPRLIEIEENASGVDVNGLRLRFSAELPSAILDDHSRWREPLVHAANRLWALGWFSIFLIAALGGAMVTLAARAALAANVQVILVLRLVGAQDDYIMGAFVRRFATRSFVGGVIGAVFGAICVYLLPSANDEASILTGLAFQGIEWVWLIGIPPILAAVAFFATRSATDKVLGEIR